MRIDLNLNPVVGGKVRVMAGRNPQIITFLFLNG